MAYTDFVLSVQDLDCMQSFEIKTLDGWLELRIKESDETKWTRWISVGPETAAEFAAALLIAAHFCQEKNISLNKSASIRELTERLVAKFSAQALAEPSA